MNFLKRFVSFSTYITTGALIACYGVNTVFCIKEGISPANERIPLTTLRDLLFIGILCGFVSALFFFRELEFSKPVLILLRILHYLLMNGIVLLFGYFFGWYQPNPASVSLMALSILLAYLFVNFMGYIQDKKLADKMNDQLQKFHEHDSRD